MNAIITENGIRVLRDIVLTDPGSHSLILAFPEGSPAFVRIDGRQDLNDAANNIRWFMESHLRAAGAID